MFTLSLTSPFCNCLNVHTVHSYIDIVLCCVVLCCVVLCCVYDMLILWQRLCSVQCLSGSSGLFTLETCV